MATTRGGTSTRGTVDNTCRDVHHAPQHVADGHGASAEDMISARLSEVKPGKTPGDELELRHARPSIPHMLDGAPPVAQILGQRLYILRGRHLTNRGVPSHAAPRTGVGRKERVQLTVRRRRGQKGRAHVRCRAAVTVPRDTEDRTTNHIGQYSIVTPRASRGRGTRRLWLRTAAHHLRARGQSLERL